MCVCVCERDIAVFGNREYRGVAGTNKQQTATATTGFVECRQLLVIHCSEKLQIRQIQSDWFL